MTITRIPAKRPDTKSKVAVYCRVSTTHDVQEDSLEMQRDYYTSLISERPDWTLAGVYADTRSGLSAEKRPQFMQMISDCMDGKINRILCKSLSRFSRNAVECRRYIDLLKMKNIAVEFEKENIKTDDQSGTFVLSLMSVVAETESKSISDNIKWGYRSRFSRGEYRLGNNRILGYDCVDGKLVPNKDADLVRRIFREYAEGKSISEISTALANDGILSRTGKALHYTVLKYILSNETYKGDKELWKTKPRDLFTKKPENNSKRKSIYLSDDHEPIIDDLTWYRVQAKLRAQKDLNKRVGHLGGNMHFLYGKIFCGKCGEPMTRRTYTSRSGVKSKVWMCRKRFNGKGCKADTIKEDELLSIITTDLGWEVFDEKRFAGEVNRVVVDGKKVTIIKKV